MLNITPQAREKLQELLAEKQETKTDPLIRIYLNGFG